MSKDFCTAYLFSQSKPVLVHVPVDFDAGSIGEVQQLDTGNSAVLTIWFGDTWLAAETASRNVLLFDRSDCLRCKVEPKHAGNIASVMVNADMRYITFIMNDKQGNSKNRYFTNTGAVEIWDVSSGTRLASYETAGHKINAAGLSDNGSLITWNAGNETFLRFMDIPVPDGKASLFLEGLCCLALDAGQNLKPKKPVIEKLPMGNWSVLNTGHVHSRENIPSKEDTRQTLTGLATSLYNDKDAGSDAWFQQCDTLWQRLLDSELDFVSKELDFFYEVYLDAVYSENAGRLSYGLDSYIKITKKIAEGSNDSAGGEPVVTSIDIKLKETLAQFKDYDMQIAKAFSDLAGSCTDTCENDFDTAGEPENLVDYTVYSAKLLQAWSEVILDNGAHAMSSLLEYAKAHSMSLSETVEPYVLLNLFEGNANAAADYMNQWVKYYASVLYKDELVMIEDDMIAYLVASEALVWRNKIEESVFDQYLRALNADIGLEVTEVSAVAQRSGLLLGDLIIEIDGHRIANKYHLARLWNPNKAQAVHVLRNGEIKTILLPEKLPINGSITIRIRCVPAGQDTGMGTAYTYQ